jgi:hypothetical protein
MADKDIIRELSDLGSSLAVTERINAYSVPPGYFEGFATDVLRLIWLSSLPKDNIYEVPSEYFEGLEQRILQAIRNHPDYQTSKEELESISPLLSSLNKRPVYSVPKGYFENFKFNEPRSERETKVISIPNRNWFKYAAAAVVTGVIILAGSMLYNSNQKRPDIAGKTPLAKFEKEVKKIQDVKSTENLIDFMDAGLNEKELATNGKTIKTEDVQQLLKDIPTDELREFSEQSKDIEDVMMTN